MTVRSSIDAVRDRLAVGTAGGLRLGSPQTVQGLTLVPIFHDGLSVEYQMFGDAQQAGTAEVTELGELGAVEALKAKSTSQIPVLLVEGEILVGLKQNRVLNTTILIPPKTSLKVPVACVEAGRWRRATGKAERAAYSLSARIRASKKISEAHSVRTRGDFMTDQGLVWEGVEASLGTHRIDSPTSAYSEIDKARGDEIEDVLRRLEPLPGQAGVLAYLADEPLSLDVFDRASTLTQLWRELAGSYIADAMITGNGGGSVDLEKAAFWIRSLVDGEATCHPAVGMGETVLITGPHHNVSALVIDGTPVHIAAAPR